MRYNTIAVSAVAIMAAISAADQPKLTNTKFDIRMDEPFTLTYFGCLNGCTVAIIEGISSSLKTVRTLTSSAFAGSFTFTLDNTIPSGRYAIKITDNSDDETNYSSNFIFDSTRTTTVLPSSISTQTVEKSSELPTSGSLSTSVLTTSISETSTATMTSSSAEGSHSLDPGRLAGIVVGAVAALLLGIAFAIFWWKKNRTTRSNGFAMDDGKTSTHAPLTHTKEPPHSELPANTTPKHELEGTTTVAELSGESSTSPTRACLSSEGPRQLESLHEKSTSNSPRDKASPSSERLPNEGKHELQSEWPPVFNANVPSQQETNIVQPSQNAEKLQYLPISDPGANESITPTVDGVASISSSERADQCPPKASQTSKYKLSALESQYAELESRRQRILDLDKIEKEQAELRAQIATMQGHEDT